MRGARVVLAASLLAAAAGLVGCPGTLSLEEKQHLAYDCPDVPRVVFDRRCAIAGCHDATGAAAGLDLASPDLEQRLLGVQSPYGEGALIDLRAPERSLLLTKLGDAPPSGERMPLGRPPLDDAAQACVRAWVYALLPRDDAGAPADAADADEAPDAQDAAAGDVSSSDAAADG